MCRKIRRQRVVRLNRDQASTRRSMSVPQRSETREATGGKAEAVLAAAERAFLAHGFGVVSMDAIAREAAVSKATVYAHFTSKEELFGAVIARLSERRFHGFSVDALDLG